MPFSQDAQARLLGRLEGTANSHTEMDLSVMFWLTSLSALVGLCCLPVALWRILFGALGRRKGDKPIQSGMSLLSWGIGLLILGVVFHPGLSGF